MIGPVSIPSLASLRKLTVLAGLLALWALGVSAQIVPDAYIVELTAAAPAEQAVEYGQRPSRPNLRSSLNIVHDQQRIVRRLLEQLGATPVDAVDTVANALLVRMPESRANRLGTLAGVRRVYRVRRIEPQLERALPLLKVPEAWARAGGESRAGVGVKIGIIDSGIDSSHPGFIDPSIPMPEGYPRVNSASDLAYTSNKIIVARDYTSLFFGSAEGADDLEGHGTGVAMAAAGVQRDVEGGTISGVAPKAWLGSYKVLRATGSTRTDMILKAMDDAVRDGMDVLNISIGSAVSPRSADDIFVRVADRLAAMGVAVVTSAGNLGPNPFTLSDLASPSSVIAVGATWNDRIVASQFELSTGDQYTALEGDGPLPDAPLSAPVRDVAGLDPTGLACGTFSPGSLAGDIAFILRGTCLFEEKLNNVQAAGAIGAVIYTDAARPEAIVMAVGAATLPGVMVSHADGLAIKSALAAHPDATGTVSFNIVQAVDPNRLANFSSRGPSPDLAIKPDVSAVGAALNTAAPGGGYRIVQGTSFSSPIVAGAVAVLMAARPGYPVRNYHSLITNAADPLILTGAGPAPIQDTGGGVLDLDRSMATTVAAYPVSISFGDTTGELSKRLTISNLGTAAETYTITVQPFDSGTTPAPADAVLAIPAGKAASTTLSLAPSGLPPGDYQGYIWVHGGHAGSDIHIPYWYAIPSPTPAYVNIVAADETGSAGALVASAILFRVVDSSGIPLLQPDPSVKATSGGGSVIAVFSRDRESPGLYEVDLRLGPSPGENVFQIQTGPISAEVTIEGQ